MVLSVKGWTRPRSWFWQQHNQEPRKAEPKTLKLLDAETKMVHSWIGWMQTLDFSQVPLQPWVVTAPPSVVLWQHLKGSAKELLGLKGESSRYSGIPTWFMFWMGFKKSSPFFSPSCSLPVFSNVITNSAQILWGKWWSTLHHGGAQYRVSFMWHHPRDPRGTRWLSAKDLWISQPGIVKRVWMNIYCVCMCIDIRIHIHIYIYIQMYTMCVCVHGTDSSCLIHMVGKCWEHVCTKNICNDVRVPSVSAMIKCPDMGLSDIRVPPIKQLCIFSNKILMDGARSGYLLFWNKPKSLCFPDIPILLRYISTIGASFIVGQSHFHHFFVQFSILNSIYVCYSNLGLWLGIF